MSDITTPADQRFSQIRQSRYAAPWGNGILTYALSTIMHARVPDARDGFKARSPAYLICNCVTEA